MDRYDFEELLYNEWDIAKRDGCEGEYFAALSHVIEQITNTLENSDPPYQFYILKCAKEFLYSISTYGSGKTNSDGLMRYAESRLWRAKMKNMEYQAVKYNSDLVQALRRCSIPYTKDVRDQDAVWVPAWTAQAIGLYKEGYADLKFWKFLNKMRPPEEPDEEESSAGPTTNKGRRRRDKAARLKVRMGK